MTSTRVRVQQHIDIEQLFDERIRLAGFERLVLVGDLILAIRLEPLLDRRRDWSLRDRTALATRSPPSAVDRRGPTPSLRRPGSGMSSLSSLVIMSFNRSFLFLRRCIRIESGCLVSIMYLITSSRSRCSTRSSSNHLTISAVSIPNSSVAQPWHHKSVPIAHKGKSPA